MEILPENLDFFNSQTGEGDPAVLQSFKGLALEKAKIVLSREPRNVSAMRVAKWALRPDFHQPDFASLTAVGRQAGFETYHLIIKPSNT